jgi:hypothetical protein
MTTALQIRVERLEAAVGTRGARQFTFSGGAADADLSAFAKTFGVELTDRDAVVHLTICGQDEVSSQHVGELALAHCSDVKVMLAYVAQYGKHLVSLDEEAA